MYSLGLLAVKSFLLAFLLTPLVRDLFKRMGMVDEPDRRLKFHAVAIPRVVALPLVVACIAAFAVVLLVELQGEIIVLKGLPFAFRPLPAVAVVPLTAISGGRRPTTNPEFPIIHAVRFGSVRSQRGTV